MMQLQAAHQLEVAYLEEEISRLTKQPGAPGLPKGESGSCPASHLPTTEHLSPLGDDPALLSRCRPPSMEGEDAFFGSWDDKPESPREVFSVPEGELSLVVDGQVDVHPNGNIAVLPILEAGEEYGGAKAAEEGGEEGEECAASVSRASASALTATPATKSADAVNDEVDDLGRGQHLWQWQRTAGGFRSYPPWKSQLIEEAYRRGLSKVRLRSGEDGKTPMEIFFVDMIQLDPQSRNVRAVRRLGARSRYVECWRHVQAITRSVFFGGPRWESFEQYKRRQSGVLSDYAHLVRGWDKGDMSYASSARMAYFAKADNLCARITDSAAFLRISSLLKMLNVIWIGVGVERGEFSQTLWDRHPVSVFLEHVFLVYFLSEIIIQVMSIRRTSHCFRIPWFRLDLACTAMMVLEVVVVPYSEDVAGSSLVNQVLRLTRLAWVLKLSDEIDGFVTALRGTAHGMRSAAVTWIVIFILLYTCSVVLTVTSGHSKVLKDRYFGSIGETITALIAHGIAMDGVSDFIIDLRLHNGFFQALVFAIFVFLTYFGLLNMLVGTFCNVAIETAVRDKDASEIRYLHLHLKGIVECYMEEGTTQMNGEMFRLVMKDADVIETLHACGTDIDGLMMLSEVLFPTEDSEISFEEFFSVIVRLRRGKPASISEIIGLQEFTRQQMDRLEELILQGMMITTTRSSKRSSVLDAGKVRRKIVSPEGEILPEQRNVPRSEEEPQPARREHSDCTEESIVPDLIPSGADKASERADRMRHQWIRPQRQGSDLSAGSGNSGERRGQGQRLGRSPSFF